MAVSKQQTLALDYSRYGGPSGAPAASASVHANTLDYANYGGPVLAAELQIAGPYRGVAQQVFVSGSFAGQAFAPDGLSSQFFVAGSNAGQFIIAISTGQYHVPGSVAAQTY